MTGRLELVFVVSAALAAEAAPRPSVDPTLAKAPGVRLEADDQAQFQRAWQEHRLALPSARPSEPPTAGLRRAQRHLENDVGAAKAEVLKVQAGVRVDGAEDLRRLTLLEGRLPASGAEAARARIAAVRAELSARLAGFDADALGVVASLDAEAEGAGGLFAAAAKLVGADARGGLEGLVASLERWGGVPKERVLSADLTYVEGGAGSPAMPDGGFTPAYLAGAAADTGPSLALDDGSAGREVELSPEILAKAASLTDARGAWSFVKNETRLEWYAGALKGSTATLRSLRGNDVDLASLLIALLRAQGTNARYVRGTIELPVARVADLLGLLDASELQLLYAPGPSAAPFVLSATRRDLALRALAAAGVAYVPVQVSGQVGAVQLAHTWVEAYVPYADYRGAGTNLDGRQWVALDPSIPGVGKYAATTPALDGWAGLNTTAEAVSVAYLAAVTPASPLDFLKVQVQQYAAGQGSSYAQTLRTVGQRAEPLELLPGALPYRVVSVEGESAFVPDAQRHRVALSAFDASGTLLALTVPLHQLLEHRTVWSYRPATAVDEQIVAVAGGLYRAPASVVNVLPVVRVDGREVAVGTRPVPLGATHALSLQLLLPGGGIRQVDNDVVAGNLIAIGLGAARNGFAESAVEDPLDTEGPAGRFLYGRAAAYATAWGAAEEELAALLQVAVLRPTANLVLVQNQLQVSTTVGVAGAIAFKGLEVDADLRTMTPLELVAGRGKELLRLSGMQGSFLEAKVLTDGTGVEAVSSTTVLQEAAARGVEVLVLTTANQAAQLPRLQASNAVRADVVDHLALGREVRIPISSLTLRDWTGTGYIARNVATEEAGYFLSGKVSGGQTIVSPAAWSDAALAEQLSQPDAPNSIADVTRVARIIKVPVTDFQRSVVGQPVPLGLGVYVTTDAGVPVRGVDVTFVRTSVGQPSFSTSSLPAAASITVKTNALGRASVMAAPDTVIARSAYEEPTAPFPQRLTLNRAQATVSTGAGVLALADPFTLFGAPDVPHRFQLGPLTSFSTAAGLELETELVATLVDRFDNPIANEPVAWTQTPGTGRFVASAHTGSHVFNASDPAQVAAPAPVFTPTSGQVVTSFVPGPVPAAHEVRIAHQTRPVVALYDVVSTLPSNDYALRLSQPPLATLDGVYGLSFPAPFVARVFRSSVNAGAVVWAPLTGQEPGLGSVTVTMAAGLPDAGFSRETHTPSTLGTGALSAVDTVDTVAFWPAYLVRNAMQQLTFTATVLASNGQQECCLGGVTVRAFSGVASVEERVGDVSGGATQDAGPCNTAPLVEDGKVDFRITNPAGFPLYARLTELPRVGGQAIVFKVPKAPVAGHPLYPDLYQLPPNATSVLEFPMIPGTEGGVLHLELLGPDFKNNQILVSLGSTDVIVTGPGGDAGSSGLIVLTAKVQPQLILPVRNPDSTANPGPGEAAPAGSTEPPILISQPLDYCLLGEGRVQVRVGAQVLSAADVTISAGLRTIAAVPGLPLPQVLSGGLFQTQVPPSDPAQTRVTVEWVRTTEPLIDRTVPLQTRVRDMGTLPVGHTFVKDVSVVDGHLVKQREDVSLPGRGPALQLSRTYSNRSGEESTLGPGWTHSHHAYVLRSTEGAANADRYAVVGGEGSGQVFTCGAGATNCRNQRGYHGVLLGGAQGTVVFRSKGGVRYQFGDEVALDNRTMRLRLQSITDPRGNALKLEYGGASFDNALVAVLEQRGGQTVRKLELDYVRLSTGKSRLGSVRALTGNGTPLGICVAYGYDGEGRLQTARRYDGECVEGTSPLREETYAYATSTNPALADNLTALTEPNGNTTQFEYLANDAGIVGGAGFTVLEEKEERIAVVKEPLAAHTRFEYQLTQVPLAPLPAEPAVRIGYRTLVTGPRPNVPATAYVFDGYGGTSEVHRPLEAGKTAVSRTLWDLVHQRVKQEVDANGRVTSLNYDVAGNLTERRTATTALPGLVGVVDGAGAPVAEVIERWTYELGFNQPTCHLDAEGRVTTYAVDSNGADPRALTPAVTGTGLRLATTRWASTGSPGAPCVAPAPTAAADITTRTRYCQVDGVTCNTVTGASLGDVKETLDGEGRLSSVLDYDSYGNARQTSKTTASATPPIVTSSTYDDRSRLKTQTDTFGHDSRWEYDGLDRPKTITRKNTKGGSPDLVQELTYFPAGQVKTETNGLGLVRTTVLDELNRPFTVTETGAGLTAPLVTTHLYDEAGNERFTTDRRGARTERHFDFADRLIKTEVTAGSGFAGEVTPVGVGGVTAELEYDAAGNKVAEADLHGHRTTFSIDSLYRVVATTSPEVPGATAGASPLPYTTRRRFDLVGNKVRETDGNGHAMTMAYDFANRVTTTTDAVGRVEFRTYDRAGNVLTSTKRFGAVNHLVRSMAYDGLNRPLSVGEVVLRTAGMGAAHNYTQQTVYDDAAHTVATKDRRGFIILRRLDDLDRVYEEVTDASAVPGLPRAPDDVRIGAALSLTTQTSYDANGNPSVSQDALGRTTTTTFDGLNRVRSRALPMGVVENFVHDGEGHVVSHTDVRGIVRTAKFDLLGRPTKQYLEESISNGGAPLRTAEFVYFDAADPGDGRTTRTEENARGNVTRHLEDALHREVETIDAQFHSVVSRYDATVRRETVDRRGYLTRFTFDDADRPTGSQDFELGAATPRYTQSTIYRDDLRTVTSLDRRGIESVQYLDGLGRVEKTTRGTTLQQEVRNTFNGSGAVTQVRDPNGHVTESVFDGAGRLLETTRGLATVDASRTTFKHDAVGNRLESKSARPTGVPYDVRESFDDLNRAVRTEDALGNVTTRAFDAAGNKLCEKRPLGGAVFAHGAAAGMTVAQFEPLVCTGSQLTRWSYDETGALLSTTDALGGQWTFLYDVTRNLMAKQDANLQLTTYEFDSLDRRTKEHQHLDAHPRQTSRASLPPVLAHNGPAFTSGTLTWSRTYDFSGNVLTTTDAKGQVATNTWGILNRLESTDYTHALPRALPSLDGIDYGFDENGNLEDVIERKTVTTPSGSPGPSTETTLRTFDLLDRLKTEARYDGKLVQYGYDLKGNRTQVLDSSAVATDYTFDALDRLKTAALTSGTTTYSYWPDSLPKGVVFPLSNGIEEKRCYDAAGRLTALLTARGAISDLCTTAAAVVSRYDYGFDANGNRTSQLEQRTNPATQALGTVEPTSYGYDEDDRLVGVKYADTGALYRLDAVGNRTGERRALASALPALLTVATFAAMSPVNLTHDITSLFTRADWLASRRDALHASDDVDLTYDANGNTLSKITPSNTRAFAWDCRDTLVSVADNGVPLGTYDYDRNLQRVKRTAGAEKVEYVLDDKYVLQEADGSQLSHPATRRYHYAAQPLAVSTGGVLTYLNVDALGSVADATSTAGVLATVRQYNAWGEYRNNTAPTPTEPKLGYTGHQFDVESGLVYARARYYDPALGIFLSRDPLEGSLGDAPSLHRYGYAHWNPLRFTDPGGFAANDGYGTCSSLPGGICPHTSGAAAREMGEAVRWQRETLLPQIQHSAHKYFEKSGETVAAESNVGLGTAVATGGQFAASVALSPFTLILRPDDLVRSIASIPGRLWTGGKAALDTNASFESRLAGFGTFAGAAGEGLAIAAAGAEFLKNATDLTPVIDSGVKGAVKTLGRDMGQSPTLPSAQSLMSSGTLDAQVSLAVERIPGLTADQARLILEGAFRKNSTAVFGGSRVRGNHHAGSDLDVGFGSLKSKQAAAIIEDATRLGPLKLEETRIITGNKTSNIERILSPEEFFQRSGIRSGRDPRAGQPYSPSGSYTFEPNGAVLYRPPGPGPAAPPPRWVPWTAAALQGNVNER